MIFFLLSHGKKKQAASIKAQLAGLLLADVLAYVHSSPGCCADAGLIIGRTWLSGELSQVSAFLSPL